MKKYRRIKALGFVEVLIAIIVTGIASAVFLTMSGRAMKELVQTERIESMAKIARDGVNIAQEVANIDKSEIDLVDYFPRDDVPTPDQYCYIPLNVDGQYSFSQSVPNDILKYSTGSINFRDSIINKTQDLFTSGEYMYEDYFMVMCIEQFVGSDPDDPDWANVYFLVGDVHVTGEITSDSDVQDLKYYSIIDL